MKKIALAAVAVGMFTGAASAADMATKTPVTPPPVTSWLSISADMRVTLGGDPTQTPASHVDLPYLNISIAAIKGLSNLAAPDRCHHKVLPAVFGQDIIYKMAIGSTGASSTSVHST